LASSASYPHARLTSTSRESAEEEKGATQVSVFITARAGTKISIHISRNLGLSWVAHRKRLTHVETYKLHTPKPDNRLVFP